MNGYLDTNVLVRHMTGDPPEMAARATALLSSAERLELPDLIVAEVVYVLESFYRVPREQVAELARAVIAFPPIETESPQRLLRTIELYERERLDFADAYLVACAEQSPHRTVVSFDRRIGRVGTIERVEP
ncbi:MAG: type II toxin-antitoxin system VapC family toxin [Patulibacter sp.]|nr:type II toxin-antitoxin system VapC family toxin [Patulibacter sp.]